MILAVKFKVRKTLTNHSARKTTDSKHCTLTYRQSHSPQKPMKKSDDDSLSINPNEFIKTPALRKTNIGSFQHHNKCGSTCPSMAALRTNCLLHFRVLNLKNVSMNPANHGVSGTDNDEHSLNNSASNVFHLLQLKAFSCFQNSSIYVLPSFHNRRMILKTFAFADYCKPSYV